MTTHDRTTASRPRLLERRPCGPYRPAGTLPYYLQYNGPLPLQSVRVLLPWHDQRVVDKVLPFQGSVISRVTICPDTRKIFVFLNVADAYEYTSEFDNHSLKEIAVNPNYEGLCALFTNYDQVK